MHSHQNESGRQHRAVILLLVAASIAAALILWATDVFEPEDTTARPELEKRGTAAGVGAESVGRVAREAEKKQPEAPAKSAVFTKALAGFKGRVVAGGQGVAGASVMIMRFDVDALWSKGVTLMGDATHVPELAVGRAVSGAGGTFLITGMWPKSFYMLRAVHESKSASTRAINRAPGPGEIVDLGDIAMEDAATIRGTVVDEQSRPVAGAIVRAATVPERLIGIWPVERLDFDTPLVWINGDSKHVFDMPQWARDRIEELLVTTTRTDANGKFVLGPVPRASVRVLVNASGLVPGLEQVDASEDVDMGTLRLGRGTSARGFVRDAKGRPVAGAEVLVGPASAGIPLVFASRAGKTDENGAFDAPGFKRGYVVAAARVTPDAPWIVGRLQTIEREIVLITPDSYSLTVAVRGRTGQPITEPRFKVLPSATRLSTVDLALLGLVKPLSLAGRVTRLEDGRHRISGLPGGWYAVQVDAPEHGVAVKTISLESDAELDILLDRERPFDVAVRDVHGEPIADAQVFIHATGEFPRIPRLPLNCGSTSAGGTLRVTEAASNRVSVRATHPGYAPAELEVELPADVVQLTLPAPGTIEGVLTEGGKTPEKGRWSIAVRRTRPKPHSMVIPRLYSPDEDGGYRVTGLQPGHYELSIVEAMGRVGLEFAMDTRVFAKQLRARRRSKYGILVTSGQTTRVDLDTQGDATHEGPTVPVSGTVMVNGRPGKGLEVTGWHERWLSAKVAADGSFDLGRVAVGNAGLYVVDPKRTRKGAWEVLWWRQVPLQEGADCRLNIELQLGALTGTVVQADGMPVRGSMIRLDGKTDGPADKAVHSTLWAATDREGRFRFDRLQVGVYEAQVWEHKYGRAKVSNIRVGRAHTANVEMRLGRVVSVEGRVDMGTFGPQPPQWAWISLYGQSSDGVSTSKEWGAEIRNDGSFLISSIPPGRYEVQISGMFREATVEPEWETRTWADARPLRIGDAGLTGVRLRTGKLIQTRREDHKKQKHEAEVEAHKKREKEKRLRRAREKAAAEAAERKEKGGAKEKAKQR